MDVLHFYRSPALGEYQRTTLLETSRREVSPEIRELSSEVCFNVGVRRPLSSEELRVLRWLLAETFDPQGFAATSFLDPSAGTLLEVGPRLSFTTAWCTNAVAICHACGLEAVERIERSRRYLLVGPRLGRERLATFAALVHDRMTECVYEKPLASFAIEAVPSPTFAVPLLQEGVAALARLNAELGLSFDEWDLEYYTRLFTARLRRNPTNVECFDIAQSNSEHSRHWFFKGKLVIDGEEVPHTLLELVRQTLAASPGNSVLAFCDNSSAIRGHRLSTLLPAGPGRPSPLVLAEVEEHILFTAETHNFPSGVAPFPGAETGTGGRIRDVQATGRGAHVVAGTVGYCVGNLSIPGYPLPWEDPTFAYPSNLATPLTIEIEASNGASDYGNKFGEPVIAGFTRSFGLRTPSGERREWIKPIMFSGGIGRLDARHTRKQPPEAGMLVVKVGGPAYRIGMGGGAASSMVQGENLESLDFNAVQRGDAEMEQKLNRVIRACVELGEANPIVSIHDQGAGGNCNVLKELVYPAGARIEIRDVLSGDPTLSVLELWGAEYQENNALLLRPEAKELFASLCAREKVPWSVVGHVTGDGRIVVHDAADDSTPVDLELADVLGDMPQKRFEIQRLPQRTRPLELPAGLGVAEALDRVLRLLAVGSKRFLTTKVDRAVTGLVAQQQCVGPLHLPVADVAVVAHSYLSTAGAATAIGERPLLALVDPAAMARMSLAEALTNLVWARVSELGHVRCSANWMWAAKLPGEGALLYDAVRALRDAMVALGVAVDGGKDSVSMAALAPSGSGTEVVKAPGTLVVSAYVACPDVTGTVTPALELAGTGRLLLVDLGGGHHRLGGSALAHAFAQVGDEAPDLDDPDRLARAFRAVQELLARGLVAAGHDRSDGGLLVTLLEMAFSGNLGIEVELPAGGSDPLAVLFAEELGLVLEVDEAHLEQVLECFQRHRTPCLPIGRTRTDGLVSIRCGEAEVLSGTVAQWRDVWEATSFQIERLQANPRCVAAEQAGLSRRTTPPYHLTFDPHPTAPALLHRESKPLVAILREEGSNGDREMAAAFWAAGFEPWDVTMSDLVAGRVELERFRGLAAVGGFSYADVLDSAKGWAAVVRFHEEVRRAFQRFFERPDTFTLGVCNGCQLFALLGWVPWHGLAETEQPRFVRNLSGRFESRFATVTILPSPAILLRGMAGSTLGIWVQHGEGRALFPDPAVLTQVVARGLAPVRYADDSGNPTEEYPFNPNGSPLGIAALCSHDGRHLAMMPHPERTHLPWQWPWMPRPWRSRCAASPWLRMFQNAREWCESG